MDNIYDPGDTVTVNGTEGFVNCVSLYANGGILYEVVWWKDGSRCSAWVCPQEINTVNQKKDYALK